MLYGLWMEIGRWFSESQGMDVVSLRHCSMRGIPFIALSSEEICVPFAFLDTVYYVFYAAFQVHQVLEELLNFDSEERDLIDMYVNSKDVF